MNCELNIGHHEEALPKTAVGKIHEFSILQPLLQRTGSSV